MKKIIQSIKKYTAEGFSLREIAYDFNRFNIPAKNGGKWHPQQIKNILEK